MSGNVATESSLDILSRAAVAAGIMDKRFKDENAPPPASPSSSEASETSMEVASYTNMTEDKVQRRVEPSELGTDVAMASKSTSGRRSSIIVYAEADIPLDMSVKKHQKRKWSSTELCGHLEKDGEVEGGSHKRKRPSVITCGNRNMCHSCDPGDVDDHFRKSLGLEYYNWVFNRAKKMLPGVTSEASGSSNKTSRNGHQDRSAAFVTPGKKNTRGRKQDIPASLKVDEHFAKSLGTLTWMRLQGWPFVAPFWL